MYALVNTMGKTYHTMGRIISKHRTLLAAVQADRRYQKSVRKNNGQSSYIPTNIYKIVKGGYGYDGQGLGPGELLMGIDIDTYMQTEAEADRLAGK